MKKIVTLSILFCCLVVHSSQAQNEKFKALFLYNFTKYIEWPSDYRSGEFIVGILGNSPIKNELEIIGSKKTVGKQPIKVKVFSSVGDIKKCHVLFIPPANSASLDLVNNRLANKPTLVITDKPGLGRKGAGINYVLKEGHQDFEINKTIMKKRSLQVNSALYSLGTVVN